MRFALLAADRNILAGRKGVRAEPVPGFVVIGPVGIIIEHPACVFGASRLVDEASDFIVRGIAQGPLLGQVLGLAEDAWLAANFPLDESALNAIADQAATRFARDD